VHFVDLFFPHYWKCTVQKTKQILSANLGIKSLILWRCQTDTYPSQCPFTFKAQEVPGSILDMVLGKFSSDLVLLSEFSSPLEVRSPTNGNYISHGKIPPFPFGDICLSLAIGCFEFSVIGYPKITNFTRIVYWCFRM